MLSECKNHDKERRRTFTAFIVSRKSAKKSIMKILYPYGKFSLSSSVVIFTAEFPASRESFFLKQLYFIARKKVEAHFV
jgi:hypothetical protein